MSSLSIKRAKAALKNAFIGDALAMPVHWYYNPADIYGYLEWCGENQSS